MAELLKGKPVVEQMAADMAKRIEALKAGGVQPTLAILRVGERPDDLSYERTAMKRAEGLGIEVRSVVLDADADQKALMDAIASINEDAGIHGCLMFRPLPKHLDETAACNALAAGKDIDCVSNGSLAAVFTDADGFAPCTAQACLEMLDFYGIDVQGKRVAVIGRSLVIGKPVAMMLLRRNATVTLCHSRTVDLPAVCREADVVVCATGRARAYGADFFRTGQCVIDVGINFDNEGKLCGDVNLDEAESVVAAVTPVPGGVGSVTTSVLMRHVVQAAERLQ